LFSVCVQTISWKKNPDTATFHFWFEKYRAECLWPVTKIHVVSPARQRIPILISFFSPSIATRTAFTKSLFVYPHLDNSFSNLIFCWLIISLISRRWCYKHWLQAEKSFSVCFCFKVQFFLKRVWERFWDVCQSA